MIYGLTNGRFIDERKFWPIFEAANELDVPLYLHPASPHPAVREAYYKVIRLSLALAGRTRLRLARKSCD